jgi:ankyrin repeat protein
MSCFKNEEEIGKAILEKASSTINQDQLLQWVNHKTSDDGFTALHFASFRGNIELVEVLLNSGADMYLKNSYGINVMHVGA